MIEVRQELAEFAIWLEQQLRAAAPTSAELSWGTPAGVQLKLIASDKTTTLVERPISEAAAAKLESFIDERARMWPGLVQQKLSTARNATLRLFWAPTTGSRTMVEVKPALHRRTNSIILGEVCTTELPSIADLISEDLSQPEAVLQLLNASRGLVFASCSMERPVLSAYAMVVAARPEALSVRDPAAELAPELVAAAQTQLVIVGLPQTDPVGMPMYFLELIGADDALRAEAGESMIGAWAAFTVQRTCGACARSTVVDPHTLERIPAALKHYVQSSYLFGRGCSNCGQSTYRGYSILSSVFPIDQESRKLLLDRAPESVRYSQAQRVGTQPMLEDGTRKIFSGITSFEEVFAQVSSLPRGYSPLQLGPEITPATPTPAQAAQAGKLLAGAATIMLVEDNDDQRKIIEAVFRSVGYDVITASNGQQALTQLESNSIDLIICDVMMPVMSGVEFVRQVRASSFHQTPVLMLTAMSSADTEVQLLDVGADDYCEKSVKRKVLLKRVERLLRSRRPQAESNEVGLLPE